ncbi:unnamed protein product [Heligmosomoides polygyrus]|uniref:Secreted protein n=1 Tax=Heligmosomoides polygyrus TaxID=6339 RepID=A0A183FC60_HELPZ|nr:unnamed protein product [Heligmosomoides polygyrus]
MSVDIPFFGDPLPTCLIVCGGFPDLICFLLFPETVNLVLELLYFFLQLPHLRFLLFFETFELAMELFYSFLQLRRQLFLVVHMFLRHIQLSCQRLVGTFCFWVLLHYRLFHGPEKMAPIIDGHLKSAFLLI